MWFGEDSVPWIPGPDQARLHSARDSVVVASHVHTAWDTPTPKILSIPDAPQARGNSDTWLAVGAETRRIVVQSSRLDFDSR